MVSRHASDVLRRFSAACGQPINLPIPVDRIAENFCLLDTLWEPIPEPPDHTVLAGLIPARRLVVFNENRRLLYDDVAFLERTVLAHELGHWALHVDQGAALTESLPGFDPPMNFVCRQDSDTWEERHAAWFMSHLLLPRNLLVEHIGKRAIASLSDIYQLGQDCQVTVTVMQIALEQMGRAYVDEVGRVHPSRQEYLGQRSLL